MTLHQQHDCTAGPEATFSVAKNAAHQLHLSTGSLCQKASGGVGPDGVELSKG